MRKIFRVKIVTEIMTNDVKIPEITFNVPQTVVKKFSKKTRQNFKKFRKAI